MARGARKDAAPAPPPDHQAATQAPPPAPAEDAQHGDADAQHGDADAQHTRG